MKKRPTMFWPAAILLADAVILCLMALSITAQIAPPTSRPSTARPGRIIGVWQPTPADLNKWKSLGINTAICVPQNQDPQAWMNACAAAGVFYIRQPLASDTAAACAADPWLLAFEQPDEPDANGTPQATLAANYNRQWGIPWFVNFSGGHVLGFQAGTGRADYAAMCKYADWVGSDVYPVAGWAITCECGVNGKVSIAAPTEAADILSSVKPGAPQIVFLDLASQGLSWLPGGGRDATPTETWAEVGPLITRPHTGVCWYTIRQAPWAWDATNAEQKLRMASVNRVLLEH